MSKPIVGELIIAGTFDVRGEGEQTGLFVRMSVEDLRTVERLPLYRRVVVIEEETLRSLVSAAESCAYQLERVGDYRKDAGFVMPVKNVIGGLT